MSSQLEYDYLFKYLLIGNLGDGKSCLLILFTDNDYEEGYIRTIGRDFNIKTLIIEGKSVKLQVWDTVGQKRFSFISPSYYRRTHGIMMVYDITDLDSFLSLDSWIKEIEKNASKNVYKILVGNKNDLEKDRKVTFEKGKEFANLHGMKFFETSAKENINVEEVFKEMTKDIINSLKKDNEKQNTNFVIEKKKGNDLNKKRKC